MFDMMKMMGKVKEFQQKMKEVQSQLKDVKAEGESGGGLVKAVCNGNKKIIDLVIDESLIDLSNKEMMKDLIIAAVNKSIEEVEHQVKEHIKTSTEGIMPNIPGIDLSGLV